jgi:hypothetical protein
VQEIVCGANSHGFSGAALATRCSERKHWGCHAGAHMVSTILRRGLGAILCRMDAHMAVAA